MSDDYDDEHDGEHERHNSFTSERRRDNAYERGSYQHSERKTYQHDELGKSYRQTRGYPAIATEIVTLSEKVVVPVKDYPKYNFLGKILGPGGSTLKNITTSTKTRISILGRGSTKNQAKEEELSKSDEREHEHLKEPLHVLIQVRAPKIEAHGRMSAALKEINKFMVPVFETNIQPSNVVNYSDRTLPKALPGGPMLRFGIPPPGAIIIGQPNMACADDPNTRDDRVGSIDYARSKQVPKYSVTDPYARRDSDDGSDRNGYLDQDTSNYKYTNTNNSSGKNRTVKIGDHYNDHYTSDYSTKKYREECYGEKSDSHNESSTYSSVNY